MIRFFKTKTKQIKHFIQRPILRTGEYLDQIVIRSVLMFIKKMKRLMQAGWL